MGRRGRPPKGPELVEHTEGSEAAKERLRIILETLAGTMSVAHACGLLGVGEARFHEMRMAWLQQSVQLMEPRPKGRPPTPEPSEEARELQRLREQVLDLSIDLRAAQIREKIALVAPERLKPAPEDAAQKKSPPSGTNSPGGTNSTPSNSAPSSGTST